MQRFQKMEILVKVNPWTKNINISKFGFDELTKLEIYKINLTAKPVDNAANKQLVQVLAQYFQVKTKSVSIQKWQTSKLKKVKIEK